MKIKVLALSDLHGDLPEITGNYHVIALAGDISPLEIQRDHLQMWKWVFDVFVPWLNSLDAHYIALVPGNHDFWFQKYLTPNIKRALEDMTCCSLHILIDETKELIFWDDSGDDPPTKHKLKIHGSPWIPPIGGKWAYEIENSYKRWSLFSKIPEDVDLLITHAAPAIEKMGKEDSNDFGDVALADVIIARKPRYAVFGHIHDGDHDMKCYDITYLANVSLRDKNYEIVYKPLEFEIEI